MTYIITVQAKPTDRGDQEKGLEVEIVPGNVRQLVTSPLPNIGRDCSDKQHNKHL